MLNKLLNIGFTRAVTLTLTMGFVGCVNQAQSTSFTQTTTRVNYNLPQVVATTSIICDLTKQIARNTINLTCLIPPNADPHLYRPKPEDRKALEQANLILYNGYNLEPGLIKLIKATKSTAPKIAVAPLALPKPQKFREDGNIVTDPHIWHNVRNAIRMVEVISSNLGKLDPSNAQTYSNNKVKINNELIQLDRWIKSRISSIPTNQRRLITTHNGMSYYTIAYGISLAGTLEGINTNERATDTQVKNLTKNIQQAKVPTIFPEIAIKSDVFQSVAEETTVKVSERKLYADGLGEGGTDGESYQNMMAANTRTIVEGLGGTYLIFEPKVPN
ncbi:metal ABC transporter substrate-binding protein [Nostoc sp. T09]|uniref:metal ABC transporter solute-binding protein, Zn/Mn family n=1 Tax=Nostoc sp. T09 TaxID=1932621 RepID=UPI000A3A7A5E|nr:zinc ABC transporter substrate-binding protein [Nostoc sp. T09]OUL26482.1 metal ABC transporter substrate-binding protein [Nostoc sp. T09]